MEIPPVISAIAPKFHVIAPKITVIATHIEKCSYICSVKHASRNHEKGESN